MKRETFDLFWSSCIEKWRNTIIIAEGSTRLRVSELCELKLEAADMVYNAYEKMKIQAKTIYFKDQGTENSEKVHLSRYKRAALITHAVIITEPIRYFRNSNNEADYLDPFFLKQRLAFSLSLQSIIQDFPKKQINKAIEEGKKIYSFKRLGAKDYHEGEDDFLLSVYKDLFFAEHYGNYNCLTMANIYGLLTDCCSILSDIQPKAE